MSSLGSRLGSIDEAGVCGASGSLRPIDEAGVCGASGSLRPIDASRARAWRACAGAAAVASTLLACGGSVFTEAPPGAGDGGAGDAGSLLDSGGGGDAGADAGDDFCAAHQGQFDFCSDFDQAGLPENWSSLSRAGGGDMQEDSNASSSRPNSLLATLPALGVNDAGAHAQASAVLTKPNLAKGATHIAFDFRIDQISFPDPSDVTATLVPLAYAQGGSWSLALAFRATALAPFDVYLIESATSVGNPTPMLTFHVFHNVLADVGNWNHIKIDFDIDHAAAATMVDGTMTVGNGKALTYTLSPPLGTALGNRSLLLGATGTGSTGATKFHFDNITYVSH